MGVMMAFDADARSRATIWIEEDARKRAALRAPPSIDGQWYVIRGAPRIAIKRLDELQDLGDAPPIELFCPKERVEVKAGRGALKRWRELPLFGPYFFGRVDLSRANRAAESAAGKRLAAIKAMDGVGGFLGLDAGGWPRAIDDVKTFQQLYANPVIARKANDLSVGDVIKVMRGPFAGHEGEVIRMLGRLDIKQRVVILLRILGGSVPTEFKIDQVETTVRVG